MSRQWTKHSILLVGPVFRSAEPFGNPYCLMSLTRSGIQHPGHRLDIRVQSLSKMRPRSDLLFCVGNAERFVEYWVKLDFAPPPVVVILPTFLTEKKPAKVHFTPAANHRNPGTLEIPLPRFSLMLRLDHSATGSSEKRIRTVPDRRLSLGSAAIL